MPKMFASSYYEPEMSKYDFDYQIVSFEDSLKGLEISDANKKMKWCPYFKNSMLYPNPLRRQSGDIDLWVEGNRGDIYKTLKAR